MVEMTPTLLLIFRKEVQKSQTWKNNNFFCDIFFLELIIIWWEIYTKYSIWIYVCLVFGKILKSNWLAIAFLCIHRNFFFNKLVFLDGLICRFIITFFFFFSPSSSLREDNLWSNFGGWKHLSICVWKEGIIVPIEGDSVSA